MTNVIFWNPTQPTWSTLQIIFIKYNQRARKHNQHAANLLRLQVAKC